MAQKKTAKRKKRPGGSHITPEGRARLSQRMKERHANGEIDAVAVGKLGGRGNTREKRRAAQALAEHMRSEKMVRAMKQTLEDGLDEEQAIGTRLKTLEIATGIEKDEAKLALQEEQAVANNMTREELIAELRKGLAKGRMQAVIAESHQIDEEVIADAVVVEDGDE